MLKTVFFLLLLVVFFSGSHQQCFSKNDAVQAPTLAEYNAWLASSKNFSITLLKALIKRSEFKNVVFSPSNIREALLLAYFGAAQKTEESIAKVLQIPPGQKKALTWKIYYSQKLLNLRKGVKNYPLKSINKIYLSNKLGLRRCMKEKFQQELESIDINTNVNAAANKINRWVEKETNGQIKEFFKYLNTFTTSALVNAVAFKGKWADGFDPENTQVLLFKNDDNNYQHLTFMVKWGLFDKGYSEELGANMLLLPHEGNRTGMIVILPDGDVDSMIDKLNERTLGFVTNKQNYKTSKLRLIIPKIEKRNKVHLETVLETLGIGNAFTVNADFSGFTGKKDFFLTEVVQEATLNVDEEGSKVSAGSGITIERRSGSEPMENFICDRHFLFIMYDFMAKKVVLMGLFRGED